MKKVKQHRRRNQTPVKPSKQTSPNSNTSPSEHISGAVGNGRMEPQQQQQQQQRSKAATEKEAILTTRNFRLAKEL
jgi:hypothetical protein